MRLRSDIWVKAYLRSCAVAGGQGYVVRHGDDDAGAIYIKVTDAARTARLFAPAPTGLDDADTERRWQCITGEQPIAEADADAKLARETAYDGDVWVIEIEDRGGRHFLDDWLAR
jgi:hypothetical protein